MKTRERWPLVETVPRQIFCFNIQQHKKLWGETQGNQSRNICNQIREDKKDGKQEGIKAEMTMR